MCKCSPDQNHIYQIDELSKNKFKSLLPNLLESRNQIKLQQQKQHVTWWSIAKRKIADLIFYNGTIYTMEDECPVVEAVAILHGRILAVGTEKDIFKYQTKNTKMVDLQRRTLMPGFIDPHVHMCFSSMIFWADLSTFKHKNMQEVY